MNKKEPREIILIDDLPPETIAMLQALYSRSPQSVRHHLTKIKDGGPEKFMGQYYVGYGHKSIGDCGDTTIFVEQVSMLVCKAIQDHPLYSGQEASTRYLDMAGQEVLNPFGNTEGEAIQAEWMSMYNEALELLVPYLTEKYPRLEDEDESVYKKAIKAKSFDIARGFLPAGTTSFVSWHTNLRQAYDHLKVLRHHVLQEVRETAEMILAELKVKYPKSFCHKIDQEEEDYTAMCQEVLGYYHNPDIFEGITFEDNLLHEKLEEPQIKKILQDRPRKAELPKYLRGFGDIVFEYTLDFASFRDIQRQRSATQAMPLLTTDLGFHPWYLDELPSELRNGFEQRIKVQRNRIAGLETNEATKQYYTAMGYKVSCRMTASLPSAVYIAELRSGQTVHPTLRVVAQEMGVIIKNLTWPLALYCDMSPDEWSVKRGKQDIIKKD